MEQRIVKKDRIHTTGLWLLAVTIGVSTSGCGILGQRSGRSQQVAKPAADSVAPKPANPPPTDTPSTRTPSSTPSPVLSMGLPASALLNVPAQCQFPQLKNGCEATSVSMLLTAIHHPMSKIAIANQEPKDATPVTYGSDDDTIVSWGNPNVGFVGNVAKSPGYGIYHGPMARCLNGIVPGRVVDLTNHPFTDILSSVANGVPVVVWTTANFRPTQSWITWKSPTGTVRATLWEHAVLVVGYTSSQIFINDPLDGKKDKAVSRGPFIAAWKQLGMQALTVTPTVKKGR